MDDLSTLVSVILRLERMLGQTITERDAAKAEADRLRTELAATDVEP